MHAPYQETISFIHLALPVGLKVIAAIICGGLIGLEREIKGKSAGLKTNILICLGAALYTIISILLPGSVSDATRPGDPGRIAAQIVSGIGFLGAGAIMQSRTSIHGLTTAATIWVVAAIGVCIGAGYPIVAFAFTLTVLFTLLIINSLEAKFLGRAGGHALEIVYSHNEGDTRLAINNLITKNNIDLEDFDIETAPDGLIILRLQYNRAFNAHKRFILDLWALTGIKEVRQL